MYNVVIAIGVFDFHFFLIFIQFLISGCVQFKCLGIVFSNPKYKVYNNSSMHHDYKIQILTWTYVLKRVLIIK